MRTIHARELADLVAEAQARPRLRMNLNLHAVPEDPVQRMVIAFEPGTYIRPHRHPHQFETFILLSGRASLLSFAPDGRVVQRVELSDSAVRVVEIPAGTWHALVSHASDTLVVEIKPGPYLPTGEADFAHWAPPEGHAEVGICHEWLRVAVPGQSLRA
ncbi:MAG: WbuC family cupin fold metalloprotein [Magnetospirillum sp.]|nr:WbuC family cupin fold metalloprotein [Magnetospirillum sp.]